MLEISNIYGHGFNEQQVERLGTMGFRIRPQVSRFAGSQVLRFIDFPELPSLEFIHVDDEKDYLTFLPKGMVPYCPGINLVLAESIPTGLEAFKSRFKDWKPYSLHANYDGSDDPGMPGWNYLNFEIPLVKDTFIWLTDPEEPKPSRSRITNHPNEASRVKGLVFDLEEEQLLDLSRLVDAEISEGLFEIDGLMIFSKTAFECSKRIANKKFPLVAVLVEVETLYGLQGRELGAEVGLCFSRPCMHIPTNELSWDLIATT